MTASFRGRLGGTLGELRLKWFFPGLTLGLIRLFAFGLIGLIALILVRLIPVGLIRFVAFRLIRAIAFIAFGFVRLIALGFIRLIAVGFIRFIAFGRIGLFVRFIAGRSLAGFIGKFTLCFRLRLNRIVSASFGEGLRLIIGLFIALIIP